MAFRPDIAPTQSGVSPVSGNISDGGRPSPELENAMCAVKKRHPPAERPAGAAHLDQLLDEALEETFPASDPVAIRFDGPLDEVLCEEDRK